MKNSQAHVATAEDTSESTPCPAVSYAKLVVPRPVVRACFRNERTHEMLSVPICFWGMNPGSDPAPLVLDEEDGVLKDAKSYRNFVRLTYSERAVRVEHYY